MKLEHLVAAGIPRLDGFKVLPNPVQMGEVTTKITGSGETKEVKTVIYVSGVLDNRLVGTDYIYVDDGRPLEGANFISFSLREIFNYERIRIL